MKKIFCNFVFLHRFVVRSRPGMTLIEMLVVINIVAILSAALVIGVRAYLPAIKLQGATRTLSANLREAQEKAVTEQNQHLIRFSPLSSPPFYQEISIKDSNEEIIKTVNLASSQSIILDSGINNNQIIFSPDGGPSSSGNVVIKYGNNQTTVNVSPAGFIKIQ